MFGRVWQVKHCNCGSCFSMKEWVSLVWPIRNWDIMTCSLLDFQKACLHSPKVGWILLGVLIYGISTLSGSFYANSSHFNKKFTLVLGLINFCRLFNAKSIFIHRNSSISINSVEHKNSWIFYTQLNVKQFYFKQFSLVNKIEWFQVLVCITNNSFSINHLFTHS